MFVNDTKGGGGSRGPQGRGGGKEGPPDLDELWRNFNRRLNDLFGGRGRRGGGGEEPPAPPSRRQLGGGAGVLVALVVAVWLGSGFYILGAAPRGLRLTPGKFP